MRPHTLAEALQYGTGVERSFLCPEHGDSRPSASLNVVKQVWLCYTCGARGRLSGEDVLVEPDYEVIRAYFDRKLEPTKVYPESWLARFTAGGVHPYWADRVGEEAARHFQLGYDPEAEAVTYPLRDAAGDLLGVVRRALGDTGPKYRYPTGVDVGGLLYNYSPDHIPALVLVEGALDAVACWQVGVPAMAIYGARLSAAQVALVDRIDPDYVYCAYDMDDAGSHAAWLTERAFQHRLVARLTWPRSWGKDVDEIGETRLRKVLSDLVCDDVACVGSESWKSQSGSEAPRVRIERSTSTSTPRPQRRTRIVA